MKDRGSLRSAQLLRATRRAAAAARSRLTDFWLQACLVGLLLLFACASARAEFHVQTWTTENSGLFQILEDDNGNLWMSSNRGIYRVSKQELNLFARGDVKVISSVS